VSSSPTDAEATTTNDDAAYFTFLPGEEEAEEVDNYSVIHV
jgi:hypothetical protein